MATKRGSQDSLCEQTEISPNEEMNGKMKKSKNKTISCGREDTSSQDHSLSSAISPIFEPNTTEHRGPVLTLGTHEFCKCCLGEDKEECPVYQNILKEYPQDKVVSKMYKMTSKLKGLCLIISNKKFEGKDEEGQERKRHGTERDVESLSRVFSRLGFTVLMCMDKKAEEMKKVLKLISNKKCCSKVPRNDLYEYQNGGYTPLQDIPQHGDAFVCCILSHGGRRGVYGIDDEKVPIHDITSPFNSLNCPELLGRPKAFFIQACRGSERMKGVYANVEYTDGNTSGHLTKEKLHPSEADFLVVMATVQNFVSFRVPCTGSPFIQTLCSQLISDCPRGENVLNILIEVNDKVSQKGGDTTCQISEATFTLRKQLVFPC